MGQAPAGKDCNKEGVGTPFVKTGEFGQTRPEIREWTTNPKKLGRVTDVLISVVGATCGKINLGADCAIGRSVAALRPNPERLNQFYLHYFLEGQIQRLRKGSQGAAQTVISKEMLSHTRIPLPPLAEQQKIVAILDEAFEGLDRARVNAEANLKSARELFERIASGVFSEISCDPLNEIAAVKDVAAAHKGAIRTGPFGSQLLHSEFVDDGIAVLGIDNAVSNEFRWGKRRFITEEKYEGLKRYTVRPGDVVITIMGTCGRCAVIPAEFPLAINTKHLCCITLDRSRCLPQYMHAYFLYSPKARSYLQNEASGSVMDGLNMGIIKELPLDLPCLGKQHQIVEFLDSARLRTQTLTSLGKLTLSDVGELRQSLLTMAFSGGLS